MCGRTWFDYKCWPVYTKRYKAKGIKAKGIKGFCKPKGIKGPKVLKVVPK